MRYIAGLEGRQAFPSCRTEAGAEVCITRAAPQQELGTNGAGLSCPEEEYGSRGTHWGLLGGIFPLQEASIGLTTTTNFPPKSLFSGIFSGMVVSGQAPPPPPAPAHALLFLTSPAWLSSKAQHEAVTVKEPCTFLKLRLQASPVWPLNCIPMLLGIVCSGLPARALLQRRGAPS